MYNPLSNKAEEFICDHEINNTIHYAREHKDNKQLIEEILEKAGSEDAMHLYLNFRGKEPDIEPLLANRGLN